CYHEHHHLDPFPTRRSSDLAEADWILPPAEELFGRAMRLATSALGITAKETHIVTDTAVALAQAGTGLGLTLASPIMMSLGGDRSEEHTSELQSRFEHICRI